jgi:hypothetical protein
MSSPIVGVSRRSGSQSLEGCSLLPYVQSHSDKDLGEEEQALSLFLLSFEAECIASEETAKEKEKDREQRSRMQSLLRSRHSVGRESRSRERASRRD